jgi:hypothetical protein
MHIVEPTLWRHFSICYTSFVGSVTQKLCDTPKIGKRTKIAREKCLDV